MKKILALLLVLCMIFSVATLVGCDSKDSGKKNNASDKDDDDDGGDEKTPSGGGEGSLYEMVSAAIEKTLKAKAYDADVEKVVKQVFRDTPTETTEKANIKATALDTGNPGIYVTTTQYWDNEPVVQEMYYDGEWKYFDIRPDGGYKSMVTLEEFAKEAGAPQNLIVALPETVFEGAESKKNDDGSTTVTLKLSEEGVETLYKDTVTEIVYDVVGDDLNQATTSDATIVVTVKNGYIQDYKLSFVSSMGSGTDTLSYEVTKSAVFHSCDEDVTVTPPDNLDKYYEMGWG